MAQLEDERDFLLASLADLEAERAAGDLDEADYAALRDGYTARAAGVLRQLAGSPDPSSAAPASPAPSSPAPAPGAARRRRLAAAGTVVALAVGAGALMARSSGERLAGDPASGSIQATGASAQLARARTLVGEGRPLEAIKLWDQVLAAEPDQPEALAYRGWFVLLAGRQAATAELREELTGRGLASIDRAIAVDPGYPDAHFFRGLVMFVDKADPAAAVAELRAFLAAGGPAMYRSTAEDVLRRALAQAPEAAAPPPPPSP